VPLRKRRPRARRLTERSTRPRARSQRPHPGVQGRDMRRPRRPEAERAGAARPGRGRARPRRRRPAMSSDDDAGRPRGWPASYGDEARQRMGFFTDTSLCIGCKACEVACKEWNQLPLDDFGFKAQSYDNTGRLSADTWRHVAFIEQRKPVTDEGAEGLRWL